MFIRGIIDRLDPVRLSRFPSITSGASGSQAAVYMHKAYLEQAVLILNTVSLIVCLVNYFAVPLLQPQVFVRNSNDCDRPDDGRCFTLNATVNWPAYSFEKGFHELKLLLIRTVKEPVANLSLKRTMTREMMKTRSLWMEYQIVWPLDLVCCISVFVLDLIRRIRRAKRLIYDLAPMFCMGLMEVAIATIRAQESYLFYNIVTSVSDTLGMLNVAIRSIAVSTNIPTSYIFCIHPPKTYFTLSIFSVFMTILDVTLILDYMDPV
ncbi:unnamed protein product [Dicrocoelium dendriticum]|nr:unnamed protein product [Dicrocoelium dendriticum]